MSISKISSHPGTYLHSARTGKLQSHQDFVVMRPAQDQATAAGNTVSSASAAGSGAAAASAAPKDNFSLRQALYGIKPPVLSDAPDADGRTGSYRAMVVGIDPTVPGNPGYADYHGLGGTAASEAQVERNRLANSLLSNIKTA